MKMATSSILSFFFVLLFSSFSWGASFHSPRTFIRCLIRYSKNSKSITKVIYTPTNFSYTPILQLTLQNLRFATPETRKPLVIVTPVDESQIQAIIYCSRRNGMRLRIRGGGHDFEGQSYRATKPFVLLDMINLRSVSIDIESKTAWIQAGASIGELYYRIAEKSETLGFPAGLWSNVGVSGLIGGGGYGMMKRKYGLAADNTLDARLIDVNGRILDRKSMGEDVFWAIRGGGCSSFGVILSWKLNLVEVPKIVTTFTIYRTLEENATKIFQPFQTVAPKLPKEIDFRIHISTVLSNQSARADGKTVELAFGGLYLGRADEALKILQRKFPQLGAVRSDLLEVTWIQAIMLSSFFNLFEETYSPEDLLDRTFLKDLPTKVKSDFVRDPIPEEGLNGLWEKLLEVGVGETTVIFTSYGGRMSEIKESALPFPNRAGTLYMVYARILWVGNTTQKLEWIKSLHSYLTPYVSNNPRRAYSNYDDLDLGVNNPEGTTTPEEAKKTWGKMYFKNNFDRLVRVKTLIDPDNFFRHEQSIPPLSLKADM